MVEGAQHAAQPGSCCAQRLAPGGRVAKGPGGVLADLPHLCNCRQVSRGRYLSPLPRPGLLWRSNTARRLRHCRRRSVCTNRYVSVRWLTVGLDEGAVAGTVAHGVRVESQGFPGGGVSHLKVAAAGMGTSSARARRSLQERAVLQTPSRCHRCAQLGPLSLRSFSSSAGVQSQPWPSGA